MTENQDSVTLHGKPFSLFGQLPKVGSKVPDAEVRDQDLNPFQLSSFKGKISLVLSVPSLDTPVCSLEAKRFNQEVSLLSNQLNSLVVSMDLPFAQKRWCGLEGVSNIKTYSDFDKHEFGKNWGVLIPQLGLLARCVFLVDQDGVLRYCQLVKEVSHEPNYGEAFQSIHEVLLASKDK